MAKSEAAERKAAEIMAQLEAKLEAHAMKEAEERRIQKVET